jgi:isopropylmalate/homocitrate/citramalate synthase/DNA-binding Lrp family transcriptional regulator
VNLSGVHVLDSTLREGELFKVLPKDAKVKIASKLAQAGVGRIELTVDYPPRTNFEDNILVVRALHDGGAQVILHGRATEQDIDSMSKYDVEGCALYIAVSTLHREFKLHGITQGEAIARLLDAVGRARGMGFRYIRATLEDASRVFLEEGESGLGLFRESIEKLKSAGATLVSLPDTSGLMTPDLARSFFEKAGSLSCLPLSAHFHNDYGFASANTIEAALKGAEEVHVTLMGIGDRNGIADTYEVVASLEDLYGVRTGIRRESLRSLYTFFAKTAGIELTWRHPLSEHAQTVRAGVHQSMTVRRKDGYIPAKKLVHDFGEPLYSVSPYISHNLIRAILAPYRDIDQSTSRRIAEALAKGLDSGTPSVQAVKQAILTETGVEVPDSELGRYFASEKFYILLKLSPQYPAEKLAAEISKLDEVDSVDEVYGDADMVIRAHATPGGQDVVTILKQEYSGQVREMRVLVTD